MSSLVKVSVENLENAERKLHEMDKSKSLKENIKNVCQLFEKPSKTTVYGLKLITTNDGKMVHSYISETNFNDIKDGYFLKLVYSVNYYVQRIFEHISDEYKQQSFDDLYNLSVEPEFIKELVKANKHTALIDFFTNSYCLENKELTACLIAIVHLFQKGYINEISGDFLDKVISVLKSSESQPEQIKYALSVIHKILCHKNLNLKKWKEEIIKQIPLSELIPYIWSEDLKDLQYGALLLINTMIRCCKAEKKQYLIKEINLKQNREYIFKNIILPGNVDKNMAHELYVYQTHLLSLYLEDLNNSINLDDNDFFERDEFELEDDDVTRLSVLMDFDELMPNNSNSMENLFHYKNLNNRFSVGSISSKSSSKQSEFSTNTLINNYDIDIDNKISQLTLQALRHYKKWHYKNFYQSQVEEKVYEPGIFVTSERIIKMLAKILHIGSDPDKNSTFYQPLIFNCFSRAPFFLELFSRTMWLLSKTRREMKASTLNDYHKVIHVLEKQLKLVLDEKPTDFKIMTEKMMEINYNTVMKYWQKEKQDEINLTLSNNPSVQVLKNHFTKINETLILKQRMNYLKKGTIFPKITENKKIQGHFFARISENQRQLIICNWNNKKHEYVGDPQNYTISNITHIVQGRACPHVKNNTIKDHVLAFSLIFDNSEYINFIAKDKKMASYWIDAFNLLLEKEGRSEFYKNELQELNMMDLMLHLIELQGITIPKKPPPVPPNPFDTKMKPPLPPKPLFSREFYNN